MYNMMTELFEFKIEIISFWQYFPWFHIIYVEHIKSPGLHVCCFHIDDAGAFMVFAQHKNNKG